MKSRIWVDIDHQNKPVIKIRYINSEDVRDKIVKRFLESFGGSSCWATFYYDAPGIHSDSINSEATITPINAYDLPEAVVPIQNEANAQSAMRTLLPKPE